MTPYEMDIRQDLHFIDVRTRWVIKNLSHLNLRRQMDCQLMASGILDRVLQIGQELGNTKTAKAKAKG